MVNNSWLIKKGGAGEACITLPILCWIWCRLDERGRRRLYYLWDCRFGSACRERILLFEGETKGHTSGHVGLGIRSFAGLWNDWSIFSVSSRLPGDQEVIVIAQRYGLPPLSSCGKTRNRLATHGCVAVFSVEGHVFNQPVLGGYYGSEVYGDLPAAPGRCGV